MTATLRFLGASRRALLAPLSLLDAVWPNYWLQNIRIEDRVEGGRFVVRAEVPGVDPDRDVHITCAEGQLRLVVTRPEATRPSTHSEFHYGRFARTIQLPPGVREDTVTATYHRGILEVTTTIRKPGTALLEGADRRR